MAKTFLVFAIALTTLFLPVGASTQTSASSGTPSAKDVLTASDRARNPDQAFRVTLTIVEYISNKPRDRTGLIVYSRANQQTGQFDNLVRYAEPPRDAGKLVLLRGANLWFYDPASKASIRISPQQRLSGQASNGDVLTVNLARDYTATIVGEENIQDADRQSRDCWHLDMTAATPDAMYNRIEYWVERGTSRSVKGKFYADSGRLLKIAYYHKYEQQLDGMRPTEVILIDAVNVNLATTIGYSDYRYQEIPDAWFQRDYLPRLRAE
ncbi:MAG TPA: outer membrane lipoprotein-sorting protein [Vicinamibacterales bacterium]